MNMFCTKKEGYAFHAVYFSMSGQILVLAWTRIITIYLTEDYYVIRLVDSVWVPSTCSFLKCSATCSAVGKEWSHFGHVKPVSDIAFGCTLLNKNMHQAAIALHKYARCPYLVFPLNTYQNKNIVGTGMAIMVNGNAYSKKLWFGKTGCLSSS